MKPVKYRHGLTADRLRQVLHYDPSTGFFTWLVKRGRQSAGTRAGTKAGDGAIHICVDGVVYNAHRLAFLYMTGRWPTEEIDHRNVTNDDNRWENLREATRVQNSVNVRVKRHCRSGLKGAFLTKSGKRWFSVLTVNRRQQRLGTFDTPEEASAAYFKAAKAVYGEFARGD